MGTGLGQYLKQGGTHPLAGHLHQAQIRYLESLGSGPVPAQVAPKLVENPIPVLLFHVDEVANDDSTDVPEPKLFGNLPGRIQVGF